MVNDLVLKELAWLVGCGTNTTRDIDAPAFKTIMAMLRPTECNEIESLRIGHRGIVFPTGSVYGRESVERKPRGVGGVLIWKREASPAYIGTWGSPNCR